MAKNIMTNVSVLINSVDLSDHVDTVTVTETSEDIDLTAMGATSRAHAPGLRDDTVTIVFFQDFAASKVDATLSALQGVAAGAPIIIKPVAAAVSTTNPSYTMTGVLLEYSPLNGSVGQANKITAVFKPADGSFLVRATT